MNSHWTCNNTQVLHHKQEKIVRRNCAQMCTIHHLQPQTHPDMSVVAQEPAISGTNTYITRHTICQKYADITNTPYVTTSCRHALRCIWICNAVYRVSCWENGMGGWRGGDGVQLILLLCNRHTAVFFSVGNGKFCLMWGISMCVLLYICHRGSTQKVRCSVNEDNQWVGLGCHINPFKGGYKKFKDIHACFTVSLLLIIGYWIWMLLLNTEYNNSQ